MITLERPAYYDSKRYNEYCGLSTDDKATISAYNGDEFYEINTGKYYKYNQVSNEWVEQPTSGGGGGGSVPKPLTYDYMPEGYPTKSVQTTTLMEEQQVAFALNEKYSLYMAQLTNAFDVVKGQKYTVNWDGTEYACVGIAMGPESALGNTSVAGEGSDTGEPFMYVYNTRQHSGMFATHDTAASHTISVKTAKEVITPMAEEFLPKKDVIVNIVGTNTIHGNTYLLLDKTDEEINNALNNGSTVKLNYYGDNLQYDLNNEVFWGVIPDTYGSDGIIKLSVVSVGNLSNGWYPQKTYITASTASDP